jgi:zinc transporter 1
MPSLRRDILRLPGIVGVHELHVWQLSGDRFIGTVHANCQISDTLPKLIDDIKLVFHRYGVHSTTIQPEFVDLCEGNADSHCHEPVCDTASDCVESLAHR